MNNKTEFILENNKIIKRTISERDLCVPEELLMSLIEGSPRVALIDQFKKNPIYVAIYKDDTVISMRLSTLLLETEYAMDADYIYPCFEKLTGSIHRSHHWEVPGDMKLWFNTAWNKGNYIGNFLIATPKKNKDLIYKLPLANTHEDGKICMGGSFIPNTEKPLLLQHGDCFSVFQSSPWNKDIRPDLSMTKKMFRFDSEKSQLEVSGDWTKSCRTVAVPFMNHLYNL